MRKLLTALLILTLAASLSAESTIKVGVATVLSGDAAVIGDNIQRTIASYEKRYLRHPIRFIFEDAKKSSTDGLLAYKHLVEVKKVDLLIGGTTSNGTLAAGKSIYGVYYLAPKYDRNNPETIKFFSEYKEDHNGEPSIAFHSAGTVDALNMLQDYLDKNSDYSSEGFKDYLLKEIINYQGLMGTYSFDLEGNGNIGFEERIIRVTN